jgi:hypothetical protein
MYLLQQIYIAVVTILATLTVKKAIDVHGQPITPPGNYRTGLLWYDLIPEYPSNLLLSALTATQSRLNAQ